MKQDILCGFIQSLYPTYKVKAEYSTVDSDKKVIVIQEQTGPKIVFYGNVDPLFNYFEIVIYGLSIKEQKDIALEINSLIGANIEYNDYQIMFLQMTNAQTIEYLDIRRVGYQMIFKTIISKIKEEN